MEREELKLWLENWLIEIGGSGINTWRTLKAKYEEIFIDIIDHTQYFYENPKFTERAFHIINHLHEVPVCPICSDNYTNFGTFEYGYHKTCGKRLCIDIGIRRNISMMRG